MNKIIVFIWFLILSFFISSCSSRSENGQRSINSKSEYSSSTDEEDYNDPESSDQDSESDESEETTENASGCKFEDGIYSATVDYNNSETGYSATYTLDVDVQDCQIVQINFPNDGYLDEDHISYADIDEDGSASVEGEDGKSYDIQIDY